MITVEVETNTAGMFDDFVEDVLLPAVIAAAGVFADQLETNLEPHRSDQTGTEEQKSEEQQSSDTRKALADSVIVIPETDKTTAEATVTVTAENANKLAWLEYGHPQVFWGNDAGSQQPPTPVMRSAFHNREADASAAFDEELTKQIEAKYG